MTRTLAAAAATAILLASAAFGADLEVPQIYPKARSATVDSAHNWSGFYTGLHLGPG